MRNKFLDSSAYLSLEDHYFVAEKHCHIYMSIFVNQVISSFI